MNIPLSLSQFKDNWTIEVGYTTEAMAIRSAVVLLVSVTIISSNLLNFVILRTTNTISPVLLTNLTTADFFTGLFVCLPAIASVIFGHVAPSGVRCFGKHPKATNLEPSWKESLYFFTWGPYSVVYFLETFGLVARWPGWVFFTCIWTANSNCFVIYSAIYASFRSRLKTILYTIFSCGCLRTSRVEPWTAERSHSTQSKLR